MLSSSRRMWSLIGGLLLGAVSFAPTLAADQKKPLVFGTDVAIVQVPVFVSGKGGQAVPGLSAKDFSVQQDGKDVDVVSFRFIDTTAPELQDEIRQTSAARRRFLLLFDKSFTDPFGLARARGAAKEFVRSGLAESDLVGVATFDFLRGIRLVANFTEDRRVVEHAIHTLGTASLTRISDPLAIAADFSSTDLTPDRDAINQGDTPAALLNDVIAALATRARSAEEQSYRARVMTLLESFDQLGLALRRVSGRKQVVYFSTGFSSTMLAGQDKVEQTRTSEAIVAGRIWEVDSDSRYGDARMRDMVQDSLQSLSRADAVVHSIDVAGIGQKEEYLQTGPTGMATRDSGGRDSLGIISEETGGRFFKDANNLLPVLREMADMTSRYYVLGVQPRDVKADGGFRKLRVKMKPKGMRISHRPGFFERSAIAEAAPPPTLQRQFEAAELLVAGDDGTPQSDTVPFRVLILPVPTDTEKQSLGVVVQIPRSSISATAGPLEVYGYATAASGDVAGHFAHFLRLDAEKAGHVYAQHQEGPGQAVRRFEATAVEINGLKELRRREVRSESVGQTELGRDLSAESAGAENPEGDVEPGPRYGLHHLARSGLTQKIHDLEDVVWKTVRVGLQGAPQRPRRRAIGAGGPPQTQIHPAGEKGGQCAELLDHLKRGPVGQHDAAGANADA